MNRPTTAKDLPQSQQGPVVFIQAPRVDGNFAALEAWYELVSAVKANPDLGVDTKGNIVRYRTQEEYYELIDAAQIRYDAGRENYKKWDNGEQIYNFQRIIANEYAKREDLEEISWDDNLVIKSQGWSY